MSSNHELYNSCFGCHILKWPQVTTRPTSGCAPIGLMLKKNPFFNLNTLGRRRGAHIINSSTCPPNTLFIKVWRVCDPRGASYSGFCTFWYLHTFCQFAPLGVVIENWNLISYNFSPHLVCISSLGGLGQRGAKMVKLKYRLLLVYKSLIS